MTHEKLSAYLNSLVQKSLQDNIPQFSEFLFEAIDFSAEPNEIAAQSVIASISLSTRLSVEMTLSILDQIDAINLDSIDYLEPKPDLRLIIGGLGDRSEPED